MSKGKLLVLFILVVFLSACASGTSWEDEEVQEKSERILSDDVQTIWTLSDGAASGAGEARRIRLEIRKRNGSPIEDFDINHEKLLHLMVISKDLSYFRHLHPEYKGRGVFEIDNDFPAGGEYRLIADFKPANGDAMTKMEWVRVPGKRIDPPPVIPDAHLDKTVDGIRVKLAIDPIGANEETTFTFTLSDEVSDKPIRDLQPYLGSIGHVVVLSEDGQRYVHVHAEEEQGAGPKAVFETSFPGSGVYKIWGQFQRNNRVFTVDYVVRVP